MLVRAVQTALLDLEVGEFHAEACSTLGYGAQVCRKSEHFCHWRDAVNDFTAGL